MKRLYDVLCFDMDGTIMKTDVGLTYAHREAARHMGLDLAYTEDPSIFIGPSIQFVCEQYLGLSGKEYLEYDRLMCEHYRKEGIHMQEAYQGMPELMRDAKKAAYQVFICTAKDVESAQLSAQKGDLIVSETFDKIYGSLHPGEEKEVILQRLLQEENIQPENAAMIGDRFTDLNGGRICGTHTIGVLYGYGTKEEVENCSPDYIVETVNDLRQYLLGEK